MARNLYVGRKPRWYEGIPVPLALLALVLAIAVIGAVAWGAFGLFFSSAEPDSEKRVGETVLPVEDNMVPVGEPGPVFDRASVDAASGGAEVNLFSALDGTSAVLDETDAPAVYEAIDAFTASGYRAGFVVLDLRTGKGVGYNADEEFFSASTVKAPFAAFISQVLLDGGEADLSDQLEESYVIGGSGVMASENRTIYELEDVLTDTIVYSDNTGYGMLRDAYEGPLWDEWTISAGVPQAVSAEGWYPFCSAKDLAKYWIAIDAYLGTESEGAQRLESLLGSTEVSFLRMALGSRFEVHAKAGFEFDSETAGDVGALNEAGIVTGVSGSYLIAVMSDADFDDQWMTDNQWLMIDLIEALDALHAEALAA